MSECPHPSPPQGSVTDYVESFNGGLKKLTVDLVEQYPADATVKRVKNQVMLAMDLTPLCIIDAVGPYLFQYQEQIYAGDSAFFIASEYEDDLNASVNVEKEDAVRYLLPRVKAAYKAAGDPKKSAYMQTVQDLLDDFLEYAALKAPAP